MILKVTLVRFKFPLLSYHSEQMRQTVTMALFDISSYCIYNSVSEPFQSFSKIKKMSKLAFYGHPLSPFARMVHMTLELLEMDYNLIELDLMKGEQKEDWFLRINSKVLC